MDMEALVSAGITISFTQINKRDLKGRGGTQTSSYFEMAQHSLNHNTCIVQQKYIQMITPEYRNFPPQ